MSWKGDAALTDRVARVSGIYHAAVARGAGDREAFVREACAGDEALRREVESLLGYEGAAARLIETPAMDVAAQMVEHTESSSSLAGRQIGPYALLSLVGVGGMGKVYRARDTKLGRDVAIKILPSEFTADADRRARFEREARLLAALNHPHIAQIYGLEEADGVQALVMELVPGETLDEIIAGTRHEALEKRSGPVPSAQRVVPDRRPLSLDRALAIARQIADALDTAHEKGIIHRDLKPANIKVTPDGTVKVLDFGLAKAITCDAAGPDHSQLPTMTQDGTVQGMILGTAAYMSPEQARGLPVDKRTDIWAFGCVLYEMLTGQHAFNGATVSDTIAAILEREPQWERLSSATPFGLRRLLQRCLAKDPRHRLRDIGDARIELDGIEGTAPPIEAPAGGRGWLPWTFAAGLLIALAGLSVIHFSRQATQEAVIRFTIPPPAGAHFAVRGGSGFAVSPDGKWLAFPATSHGKGRIWLRALDAVSAQPVPDTDGGRQPFWSPDSQSIGFFANDKLKRINLSGGVATTLADAPSPSGATWSPDGVIVFAPNQIGPLYRVAASDGTASPVTTLDAEASEISHRYPWFLPDGKHFLYTSMGQAATPFTIWIGELDSPAKKRILQDASSFCGYAQGWLIYARAPSLLARPFDPKRLAIVGEAEVVSESVVAADQALGYSAFSVSTTGLLAYWSGDSDQQLTWFDRKGTRLGVLGGPGQLGRVEFSPDGKAATSVAIEAGNRDIWLYDLLRGLRTRLTFDMASDDNGVWSPDGRTIVFSSNRKGVTNLYRKAVDGGPGSEEVLYADNLTKYPMNFTPDGKYLVYFAGNDPKTHWDIWVLPDPLGRPGSPFRFKATEFVEVFPQFSPDGKWIAYVSDESKRREVYVAPFPGPGASKQISVSGGDIPQWRRPGVTELFYIAPNGELMAAPLSVKDGGLEVGKISALGVKGLTTSGVLYDVAPGGQRFLAVVPAGSFGDEPLTVVQNWTAALKK